MIERTRHGQVAIVAMRHGRANALDLELCDALRDELEGARREGARAVVLTGRDGIFCAGVDLHRVDREGVPYLQRFLPAFDAAFEAALSCPLPLVAAVNGHAIAGGCVLAAAADHRIMAAGTGRIGVPELKVGVPFPAVALEILRFAVSPAEFQGLMFQGTTFLPEEARRRGLVEEVVASETLMDRALEVAAGMASVPSEAFALTKAQVRAPALDRVRENRRRFGGAVQAAWESDEVLAALRDYVGRVLGRR